MTFVKRSAIALVANITKALISMVSGLLIARGLGPGEYGVFAFLLASFTSLRSLLDAGTSSAFFSFASKQNRSRRFFGLYFIWLFVQFVLLASFIALLAPENWIATIWQGENRTRVLVAFVAVFLQNQLWNMVAQIGESQRLTAQVQLINIGVTILYTSLIIGLYLLNALTVDRLFLLIALEFTIATMIAWFLFPVQLSRETENLRDLLQEYWIYCKPLIPYAWLGLVMSFADTWLLQRFGGAVEQAYYSIGYRFASISIIVTTSVLRIFWKEIAEANYKGNLIRVQQLYEHTSHILFIIGVVVSGFLIPWSVDIIRLVLGEAYLGGAFVLTLMFVYPIHQALGQLTGTMYYALEMTRPYVLIGIVSRSISIIAVYFLLAPNDALIPGLGLASTGLALKMVVLNIIVVNFSIWWLSRHRGWRFSMLYQLVGLSSFAISGYLAKYLVTMVFLTNVSVLIHFILSGLLYTLIGALIILIMPWLIGASRKELKIIFNKIFSFIFKNN